MTDTPPPPRIAGAILAGGQARRRGNVPKGVLCPEGDLGLVERLVIHLMRMGVDEIVIVASEAQPYTHIGCVIVGDRRTDAGPLAGIETALAHFAGRCDAVLCLACDFPALSWKEMSALVQVFAASGGPVLFAQTPGLESPPLCAIVRTDLLEQVSAALDRGEWDVHDLWRRLGGVAVRFDDPRILVSLNSPRNLEAWRTGRSHDTPR